MGNAPWLNKWGRSPRQDRRVIENGKFVEQGKVHAPEPPIEVPEQEQSALEIVQEPVNVPVREEISETVFEEARYDSTVDSGASAGRDVSSDESIGLGGSRNEAVERTTESNRRTETGAIHDVSNSSISTPEGQSVSEVMQTELEPIKDAEPLTLTTEVGGGYVAIEVDRS